MSLEGNHFAIAQDGDQFLILDTDEVAKCTRSDSSFCPTEHAIRRLSRSNLCLASAFKENTKLIADNCHFEIKYQNKFRAFRHLTEGHRAVSTRKSFGIRPACDINNAHLESITVNPLYSVINLPSGCVGYTDGVMLSTFYEHAEISDSPSINKIFNKFNIRLDWPNDWNVLKSLNVTKKVDIPTNKIKLPALPTAWSS